MNSEQMRECVDYFKKQPAFHRAFLEMKRQWERYGDVVGNIVLKEGTPEEKHILGQFLGVKYRDKYLRSNSGTVSFRFEDFEKSLCGTKYAGIELKQLLEAYHGERLVSNKDREQEVIDSRRDFWVNLQGEVQRAEYVSERALHWLSAMKDRKQSGYGAVMRIWKESEKEAKAVVKNVCHALKKVLNTGEEGIPLAVLAAQVSGNPHYFDKGRTALSLLLYALCEASECEVPYRAFDIQQFLWREHIISDEIASTVAVYQLHMKKEGDWYEVLEAYNRMGEPAVLSLANLKNYQEISANAEAAYVVENEMVFTYLAEQLREENVTILCTSGQLSCAAQRVIDALCRNGCILYYSGDIDPEGLGIADRLWRRYPDHIKIWRMSDEDYTNSLSEEVIDERRMRQLAGIENPILAKTAAVLKKNGRAGYQENIIEQLLRDIITYMKGINIRPISCGERN